MLMAKKYKLKEATVRLVLKDGKTALYNAEPITNPSRAIDVVIDFLKKLDREHLVTVNMDNEKKPINYHIVSIGNINTSIADIGNIFKAALLSNANAIILLHNHPSGDVTPSGNDLVVTVKVIEAGKLLGVEVLDHIIVGGVNGAYNSLAETTELFN